VSIQGALHGQALHTDPSPVHQPYFTKTSGVRLVDVLFDDRRNVARRERVEVELRLDRNADRVVVSPLIHIRP